MGVENKRQVSAVISSASLRHGQSYGYCGDGGFWRRSRAPGFGFRILSLVAPEQVLLAFLIFSAILWLPAVLAATTVVSPSFEELVDRAELVFEGRLTGRQSRWVVENGNRTIKTFYTFQVDDVLKGSVETPFVLEVLGGTVGVDTLVVEGAPDFKVDEPVILFITDNGEQYVPLVGIMHGYYRFLRSVDKGKGEVVTHQGAQLSSVEAIGKPLPSASPDLLKGKVEPSTIEAPLTPESFKERIRSRLSQGDP